MRCSAGEGEGDGERAVKEAQGLGGEGDLFEANAQRRRVLEQNVPVSPGAGVVYGVAGATDVLGGRTLYKLGDAREGTP